MSSHDMSVTDKAHFISIPPAQTVCEEADPATITVYSTQPAQTVYQVDHITHDTVVTVWVGSVIRVRNLDVTI